MKRHNVLYDQAEELTTLREKLGITIKVLAKEMDRAESTVGLWCCGKFPCDMKAVKAAMKRIVVRRYEEVREWDV